MLKDVHYECMRLSFTIVELYLACDVTMVEHSKALQWALFETGTI